MITKEFKVVRKDGTTYTFVVVCKSFGDIINIVGDYAFNRDVVRLFVDDEEISNVR